MPANIKTLVYGVSAAVVVAIVAGFFLVGTPKEERLRQFDEQRVWDLQGIQSQVVYYWQQKGQLPPNLDELRDDINNYAAPNDPETAEPYAYTIQGPLTFELCATFALSSDAVSAAPYAVPRPMINEKMPIAEEFDSWKHDAGRVCFERTIDPERHKLPG